MIKHYILDLNPQANSDWDRCILRNPITGERPDLTAWVAEAINHQEGSYLIKVSLEVEILEQNISNGTNTVKLPSTKQRLVPLRSSSK